MTVTINLKQRAIYFAIAATVIGVDQLTKHFAATFLAGAPPVEVLPVLRFALVFNEGAAFGFLSDAGGWQRYFLAAVSAAVSVFLGWWLWQADHRHRLLSCALALILGGALGNLIDRVGYEHVIDFILLHYADWHFPAFNIADSAITVGALGLIIDCFGKTKRDGANDRHHDGDDDGAGH